VLGLVLRLLTMNTAEHNDAKLELEPYVQEPYVLPTQFPQRRIVVQNRRDAIHS